MTEVELSRALMLTYAGVGAAFVVLGSLIVYTLLLGGLGNWRARRQAAVRQQQQPREETEPAVAAAAAAAVATAAAAAKAPAAPPDLSPQLAAAIAAAVAMAREMQRREQAERAAEQAESTRPAADSSGSSGWKEQGRIAAFDTRRLRERER